jgi:DNA repair protein RecO (recombination protein O)
VLRQQRDEAYVLRTQELGESDLIVSLLAESHGKVRGVARAARRSRKRFGGALDPLTRVRATWFEKEGRDLHRLEGLESLRSFAAMQSEPLLQATCAVLAELSEVFSREGQSEPRFFKLLGAVLEALERRVDPLSVIRYFEYWTLRLNGLLPDLQVCSACGAAPPGGDPPRVVAGQGILCRGCRTSSGVPGKRLSDGDLRFLAAARRTSPAHLGPDPVPAARAGGALEALLRGTLETFAERPFRAYRHLHRPGAAGDGAEGGR